MSYIQYNNLNIDIVDTLCPDCGCKFTTEDIDLEYLLDYGLGVICPECENTIYHDIDIIKDLQQSFTIKVNKKALIKIVDTFKNNDDYSIDIYVSKKRDKISINGNSLPCKVRI